MQSGDRRRQHQTYFPRLRLFQRAKLDRTPGLAAAPFLPKDLAGALKWLDDVEIDALLAGVTEAECRRRRPPEPAKKPPQQR
jgi:hypothetical protein